MFGDCSIAEFALIMPGAVHQPDGAISDFIATFNRERNQYSAIEKRAEALCKKSLRNIDFSWRSRVKKPASLEKKLRDRSNKYEDEAANVADVWDLVGGRIVLARYKDIRHVKRIMGKTFNVVRQTQHPKDSQNIVSPKIRFRGYNGLHLYVKLPPRSDEQYREPVIEIQVMTGFMWVYTTLEHDVVYKKLHGEPTPELLLALEMLRGIANTGELALENFDERFFHHRGIYPDLQTRVQSIAGSVVGSIVGEGAFSGLNAQSQSVLQLTNPQHDKDRAESSTGQWFEDSAPEECAYALLRKQTRNKEAHLEGVAEARQTLQLAMPSQDDPLSIQHLRKLYHLAVAERKLSLKHGLCTGKMMEHLDQAETYMDMAADLDIQSGLVGAQEQMTLERNIIRGLKAKLQFRIHVRDVESPHRLLGHASAGIEQALKDLEKVDVDKFEKNKQFGWEWINYFRKFHARF